MKVNGYDTTSQRDRDMFCADIEKTVTRILSAHIDPSLASDIMGHDDYFLEKLYDVADNIAMLIDWARRRACAQEIAKCLQLAYDDGRIDTIMDLLAQHWDDAEYLMDRIKRHDLPSCYDWLYNARPRQK